MIRWLTILLVTALAALGEYIPSDRVITWVPGIPGGIPTNQTVFASVKDAPYNAVGDGVANDFLAISNAIAACPAGQVVYFPAGTYYVTNGWTISKGIVLRGAGSSNTVITGPSSGIAIWFSRGSEFGTATSITNGFTKGSSNIVVATPGNFVAGSPILISQTNAPGLVTEQGYTVACTWCGPISTGGKRTQTQIRKVSSITGNTLNLDGPLYWTMDATLGPLAQHVTLVTNSGIEGITLRQNTNYTGSGANIRFVYQYRSWVRDVQSLNNQGGGIKFEHSYQCEVRDSYIGPALDTSSGRGYGIWIYGPNSDHLIENNIVEEARHSLIFEGGGSGCVFAYNFAYNVSSQEDYQWLYGDMDTHGAHPFMNLFEGNVFGKLALDNTLGSASHNTAFRNSIVNQSTGDAITKIYARWPVDIQQRNYSNAVVANVIGRPGDTTTLWMPTNIPSTSTQVVYRIGFTDPSTPSMTDTNVAWTTFIHGNYSYPFNTTTNAAGYETNFPASMYLASKPAWFGGVTWPPIGPDVSGYTNRIPAQYRYSGQEVPGGGGGASGPRARAGSVRVVAVQIGGGE